MAQEPQENVERNKELYSDYKSGMSFVDLVVKYRISSQRIYQIIKKIDSKFPIDK